MRPLRLPSSLLFGALLVACSGEKDASDAEDSGPAEGDAGGDSSGEGSGDGSGDGADIPVGSLDPDNFASDALVESVSTEPCTLSGGTTTTCYRIVLAGTPADHDIGPFCPRSIDDDASVAGIWPEGGEVYDVSGAFIVGLAELYGDAGWQLYDPATGEVNVTDTQESCEGAARPDVDPEYQNHCVECSMDYITTDVSVTVLLPVTPVALSRSEELDRMGKVGVALSGVVFDPPAPTEAILAAYTIAAFDDCGGHVNLGTGYHYHAATGCSTERAQADGHAPLIGYALDGYGMYAMLDEGGAESADLDACRGHTDDTRGYHYHVASAGENSFIGCFHGEQGEVAR